MIISNNQLRFVLLEDLFLDGPPMLYDSYFDQLFYQPHAVLGIHKKSAGAYVIRLWRPGAPHVYLEVNGDIVEAKKVDSRGFFEYSVPAGTGALDYRIYHTSGTLQHDPYAFLPSFGEVDQYLFSKGVHYELYKRMGGRLTPHQGVEGATFSVWAPNAKSVSLIADFNHWSGSINPMRSLGYSGVWELFVPGLQGGEKYKFEIKGQDGEKFVKSDPYGVSSEFRPLTASLLADFESYKWNDRAWLEERAKRSQRPYPMATYEVHLGSWRKKGDDFLNYREIAHQLASYVKELGFNYVELMPIQEHPLDESWGYQVSGFYAPTSRFGSLQDFQYFVDYLHQNGIGVILDWVPGHFPTDTFSLGRFDGSAAYEHADPKQGFHPHWNTHIFNFGRHEVSNFLIANALYWFEQFHIDGLRVDAVASMLYLDYGREAGDWIPNAYGGKENLQAIEFMKHLNSIVHEKCPGVLTIAEESTSFTGVTHPVAYGGLGFDLKWNMGWMNDTLRYIAFNPLFRTYHHHDLTFGLLYAFSERFVLVFSHDEVVHGKKSLLSKMPGDDWQKFANLRLLYSYMICQPGKKLLFMGGEIGEWREWNCKQELDWILLDFQTHQGIQRAVGDINHFYLSHQALWERDFSYETFEWIDLNDAQNSVVIYYRKSQGQKLLCIHHFTPQYFPHYFIHASGFNFVEEVFNSDNLRYGGSGKINQAPQIVKNERGETVGLNIQLPPLATLIFSIK